jgi:LPXTG-motif cell wall-anchored protein
MSMLSTASYQSQVSLLSGQSDGSMLSWQSSRGLAGRQSSGSVDPAVVGAVAGGVTLLTAGAWLLRRRQRRRSA